MSGRRSGKSVYVEPDGGDGTGFVGVVWLWGREIVPSIDPGWAASAGECRALCSSSGKGRGRARTVPICGHLSRLRGRLRPRLGHDTAKALDHRQRLGSRLSSTLASFPRAILLPTPPNPHLRKPTTLPPPLHHTCTPTYRDPLTPIPSPPLDYDGDGDLDLYVSRYADWEYPRDDQLRGDQERRIRRYVLKTS